MCTFFTNSIQLAPNIGDSGSWVVGEQSYGVYGHLVAADALGEAYVVPFDKTLLDIKHSLGAVSVCLPSRSEFPNWRNNHYVHELDRGTPGLQSHPIAEPDSGYASVACTPDKVANRVSPRPLLRPLPRPSRYNSRDVLSTLFDDSELPWFIEFEQTVLERPSPLIEPEQPAVQERNVWYFVKPKEPVPESTPALWRRLVSFFRKVYKPSAESDS